MPTRRSLSLGALVAAALPVGSAQHPRMRFLDLPPKTTLWGGVVLFSDDLIEATVATARDER